MNCESASPAIENGKVEQAPWRDTILMYWIQILATVRFRPILLKKLLKT